MLRTSQDLAGREKVTRDGRGRRWWCQCWAVASTLRKMGRLSVWAGVPSCVPVCVYLPLCASLCACVRRCVPSSVCLCVRACIPKQIRSIREDQGARDKYKRLSVVNASTSPLPRRTQRQRPKNNPRDSGPFLKASKRQGNNMYICNFANV